MTRFGQVIFVSSLFLTSLLHSGCVPVSEYNKLKDQFDKQEKYVKKHKNDVRKASRETTSLAIKLREKDIEVRKLRGDNQSLNAKLHKAKTQQKTAKASFSKSPSQKAAPKYAAAKPSKTVTPSFGSFKVNPKTKGIILDQSVLFAAGSARLRSQGKKELAKLARLLNSSDYRHTKVRVEGHTDSSPITRSKSVRDNWQLSGMRARTVLNTLESQGVRSSRLSFAGYAFHKPLVAGSGKKTQARNRRVEVLLID